MQTTLLSIAILLILALVTALVGPLFVDWNKYRAEFEAEASRLSGLQVRLAGPIEARLLPTPTLTLQKVDIFRPGDASAVRAKKLSVEFALGALVRGEWRAHDVRVEGAEFALGLDASGRIDWPAPAVGFDPDAISIESLDIVDSRAILADGSSNSGLVIEQLEFRGELRSLAGPVKGQGSFYLAGQHYPYRLSASRAGDDGAVRVRLSIDPIDRPLIGEADASITIERGIPRFDGTLQISRAVGRAPKGSQELIIEPWRITSKIRGDSKAAVLEQVEFQYGPDDRAIKLKGDARVTFGREPHLEGVLSSTQIDLDRMLALSDDARRRPLVGVKSVADYIAASPALPMPVKLGISVEQVTLAGAMIQRVSVDVRADTEAWDIESLDFRAPGAAQVRLSGRLGMTDKSISFTGPAKVEALDPRAFVAWLTDRADPQTSAPGTLRAEGEVKLDSSAITVERFKAELDRMTLDGRFAYAWASGDRPPRLEATLSTPDIDLDRAQALAQGIFGERALDWPREGAVVAKVGRASLAGIEAKSADIKMKFDADGLDIERLTIGDFGGAALGVKGRIDTRTPTPRGAITLDLEAKGLEGLAVVAEKFSPQLADELRRNARRLVPAKLRATLAVNSQVRAAGAPGNATFKIEGNAGPIRVALQGDAGAPAEAFTSVKTLGGAGINLNGRLDAGDSVALIELLGLDRLVAVDTRPGRFTLTASGPLDGDLTVDGQVMAGGLDLSAKGSVRLSGRAGPTAGLDIKVGNAHFRSPRLPAPGRTIEVLPAALTAKLALAEDTVSLTDLNGKIGGTDVSGRLKVGFAQTISVDGDLALGAVDLPANIATVIGVPNQPANAAALWPSEPFELGALGNLSGQLKVRSARIALTPTLAAQDVRGILHFDQSDLSFEEIDGALAGGRVAGQLSFERGPDGLTVNSRVRLAGAKLDELLPGDAQSVLSGQLSLDVNLSGTGRSAIAVVGSLRGGGTFTLQDGRIARLDPGAFDTIIRDVDQGLPIDVTRIRDRMELALANAGLTVPLAEGEIAVATGQARLNNTMIRTERADLAVSALVDLAHGAFDASVTLSGPAGAGGASTGRPELGLILKGPVGAPKRTLEVAALANWLSLRRIEQQTKRIDELEAGREQQRQQQQQPPAPPAPPSPATAVPPAAEPPRPIRSAPAVPPSTPRRAAAPTQPASASTGGVRPPVDIRPQAAPRAPRGSQILDNSVRP